VFFLKKRLLILFIFVFLVLCAVPVFALDSVPICEDGFSYYVIYYYPNRSQYWCVYIADVDYLSYQISAGYYKFDYYDCPDGWTTSIREFYSYDSGVTWSKKNIDVVGSGSSRIVFQINPDYNQEILYSNFSIPSYSGDLDVIPTNPYPAEMEEVTVLETLRQAIPVLPKTILGVGSVVLPKACLVSAILLGVSLIQRFLVSWSR
jgi:hypothetical protein